MSCFTFNCSALSCGADSNIKFLQFNQLRKKQKQKQKKKKKRNLPPYVDDMMDYDHKAALLLNG
jgi:hypothetical protein